MSSLALYPAHLLLHPTVTRSLAVLGKIVGRDKIYRLIQYAARVVSWYLLRAGKKDDAARWTGLQSGMKMGRKLMRIGKPVEHAQSAVKLAHAQPTDLGSSLGRSAEIERVTQIARQLAYFGYLSTDTVLWLQYTKFLRLPAKQAADLGTLSNRLWLAGIVFSLLSSAAGLVRVRREARRAALVAGEKNVQASALVARRAQLGSQMLLDALDFCMPATNLGILELDDRKVGVIGVITSWMALRRVWEKA